MNNSLFNWQPRNVLAHTHTQTQTHTYIRTLTTNQIVIYFVRQSNSHFISVSIFANRLGIQSANITKFDLHNTIFLKVLHQFLEFMCICVRSCSVVFVRFYLLDLSHFTIWLIDWTPILFYAVDQFKWWKENRFDVFFILQCA